MSIHEQLLDDLDASREQTLVAIADLPDDALLQPDAVGRFSIADILVNLTVWEAELVTGLMRLDQGRKPGTLLAAMANRKEYNQKRHKENQGRDLDRIFDDLQKVRIALEGWLESFSDRALTNPKKYKWFKGRSLRQIIEQVTIENESRYLPLISAYAHTWQAAAASAEEQVNDKSD